MVTRNSEHFSTCQDWLENEVTEPVVLRGISALEYMGYFCGWNNENEIYVYAVKNGEYSNIDYRIIDSFKNIETASGNIEYTSFNQTVNDLLEDFDSIDPQPLLESLNEYYHANGMSFSGLDILPEHQERFREVSDWALEYYDE